MPLPTRSVTSAFMRQTLPAAISGPETKTQAPSLMPRSAASAGLISMNMSCCNSASHLLERVSSPPPSYSTSRPEVRMSGKFLAMPLSTAAFCTEKPMFGTRNCAPRRAASDTWRRDRAAACRSARDAPGRGSGRFRTHWRAPWRCRSASRRARGRRAGCRRRDRSPSRPHPDWPRLIRWMVASSCGGEILVPAELLQHAVV